MGFNILIILVICFVTTLSLIICKIYYLTPRISSDSVSRRRRKKRVRQQKKLSKCASTSSTTKIHIESPNSLKDDSQKESQKARVFWNVMKLTNSLDSLSKTKYLDIEYQKASDINSKLTKQKDGTYLIANPVGVFKTKRPSRYLNKKRVARKDLDAMPAVKSKRNNRSGFVLDSDILL